MLHFLQAERKKQERIKRELELELRQQQIALKLMQEAKSNKVKAADASNHNDESTQSIQDDADKNSEAVDGSDMEEDKEELTDVSLLVNYCFFQITSIDRVY